MLTGGLLLEDALGISPREGAYAMGLAFTIGPALAVLAGALAAVWTGRRAAAVPRPTPRARPAALSPVFAAMLGAAGGYAPGWLVRWLWVDGLAFDAYWQALLAP